MRLVCKSEREGQSGGWRLNLGNFAIGRARSNRAQGEAAGYEAGTHLELQSCIRKAKTDRSKEEKTWTKRKKSRGRMAESE